MSTLTETRTESIQTPLTPNLAKGSPEEKREEIRRYFHATYDAYEALFEPLHAPEAFLRRADPLRHPLIFYFGHTAVFFVNKLVLAKLLPERINPRFESMFAVGVDEMSWDDLNEAHYDWPDPAEVLEYRRQVRSAIDQLITELPLTLPIGWDSPFWVIMMGTEHERIHLETSSVLIRQLPLELLDQEHPVWKVCEEDHPAPANELMELPGGTVRQGKPRDHELYGWDNEYGVHVTEVPDMKASRYLVSNAEFKEFIDAGGYEAERYWTEEGWKWRQYTVARHPLFWRRQEDGSWKLRCMLKEIDMPWSWPVELNYLEAKAFCNWKAERTGKPIRLPTEEEWYRLHDYTETGDVTSWSQAPGNLNLEHLASSCPVDRFAFKHGFYDVMGNVWQHTETPIAGYEGFQVHPLYDDFSTPTFDTKHNLIKGGSWISTGNEATRDSRYAFRRHFFQHAGLRYVESDVEVVINDDRYETDPEVVPYCELHYGPDYFGVENYPEKLAQLCLDQMRERSRGAALNLGAKAGRTTFELAAGFDKVVGVDASARTIRIGVEMMEKGYTQWEIPKEGEIVEFRNKHLKDFGLEGCQDKVEFLQADLSNIKDIFTGYDLIVIDNMLERAYDPGKFLAGVHERLNDGGLLIIATTGDWHQDHTEKGNWLGGYKDAGENVTTLDGLHAQLDEHFERLGEPQALERVLRRNARCFEHDLTEVTVWAKR